MADAKVSKQPVKKAGLSVDVYAVQCEECFKWRVIDTQEEFEDIRSKLIEDPFICHKKTDTSCEDPPDIEYDDTRTWAIDKPNIPKPPKGFNRNLVMRSNFSKMDTYYTTPTGKRVRSLTEITSFLEANPDYKGLISLSNFNFSCPKIMEETIPKYISRDCFNGGGDTSSSSKNKKFKKSKDESQQGRMNDD